MPTPPTLWPTNGETQQREGLESCHQPEEGELNKPTNETEFKPPFLTTTEPRSSPSTRACGTECSTCRGELISQIESSEKKKQEEEGVVPLLAGELPTVNVAVVI